MICVLICGGRDFVDREAGVQVVEPLGGGWE